MDSTYPVYLPSILSGGGIGNPIEYQRQAAGNVLLLTDLLKAVL